MHSGIIGNLLAEQMQRNAKTPRCHVEEHARAHFLCAGCCVPVCRLHSEGCCRLRFCERCIEKHRRQGGNNGRQVA